MRPSTVVQDAAISSVFRDVELVVSVRGSTKRWPVDSFQTDAQMKDTPLAISTLGGVAARQVKFTLDHTLASTITPYQKSIVPAPYPLPIGSAIKISVRFWPTLSRKGTPTYEAAIFTGYIVDIDNLDAVSDITITAQDESYNLGSTVDLPAAGAVGQSPADPDADTDFSTLLIVDLMLRGCKKYLTAPPVLFGDEWTKYTVLSVPGYGGNVPDVGIMTTAAFQSQAQRTRGKYAPDLIMVDQANYRTSKVIRNYADFQLLRLDLWAQISGPGNIITIPGGRLYLDPAGQARFDVTTVGGADLLLAGVNCAGNGWHHFQVELVALPSGVLTGSLAVDGVARTATGSYSAFPLSGSSVDGDLDGDYVIVGNFGVGPFPTVGVECLELIIVPTGDSFSDPASRFMAAPTVKSLVTATSARLQAIAPQSGLNAWGTIQSVAAAEGALCWFDEDGTFIFEPQSTWLARRTSAPSGTYDESQHSNLAMQISADGVRKSITANYASVSCVRSSASSPAYVADSVFSFPPGVSNTQITTDQRFYAPFPAGSGASNAVGQSWFTAVASSLVGDNDPANVPPILSNVAVAFFPTSLGFTLTVSNPNPYSVSFWNPTDGIVPAGPMLIIHGTKIVTADPVTVTQMSNRYAKDDLVLDDNVWRQDRKTTRRLCHAAAGDTFQPIPVISNIDVPGDPRDQLGDIKVLQDPRLIQTPGGLPVVLVDIAHNYSPEKDYRMTLGVRPLGPPTGWLLGVPGRSELGSTTYLPIAWRSVAGDTTLGGDQLGYQPYGNPQ